jgi:hypothetical protein
VSRMEEAVVRRFSGLRIIAFSIAAGVLGVLPLQLYIWFGPRDGNPIGLGLLAVAAVPLAAVGVLVGLVKLLIEYLSRGRR